MAKSLQTISSLSLESDVPNLIENISKLDVSANVKWPDWLQAAETPINWLPKRFENVNSQEVISRAKERVNSDDLLFDKFIQTMALVYEYCQKRKFEETEISVKSAENLLKFEGGICLNSDITTILNYERAFKHVLLAIKAQISILQKHDIEKYPDFVPYSAMSKDEQSAIQALKAKFFSQYRKKGFQKAVECSRRAVELKPDEPLWMILLADSLRRISKYDCHYANYTNYVQSADHMEEMQLLEKAVSLERNPRYMVHLAVRYNTCAVSTIYKYKDTNGFYNSELYEKTKQMEEKALALCKEALELAPDNEVVNRRCGFALMKASYETAKENRHLIKKSFEKSLEMSPSNSMTLHYFGKYYTKFELNDQKALECLENASKTDANFYAQCDLIKVKFKIFGVYGYDPLEDLDDMVKKHSLLDIHYKLIVLSYKVSYLLLIKRNLNESLEYFEQLIDEVEDLSIVKKHCTIFSVSNNNIDLCKVMANEIRMAGDKLIQAKQGLIHKMKTKVPEYFTEPVEQYLTERTLSMLKIYGQQYDPQHNPNRWNYGRVGWQRESSSSNRSGSTRNYGNQRTTNSSASTNWRARNSSELEKTQENWRSKK